MEKQTSLFDYIKKLKPFSVMTKRWPTWYYGKRDILDLAINKHNMYEMLSTYKSKTKKTDME